MDNNDLKKALWQAFSEEAPELLQKARSALLDLESAPVTARSQHMNSLKRALHSIKGSASAIGRADIRDVSHLLENLFADLAGHELTPPVIDRLYAGLSFLGDAIIDPAMPLDTAHIMACLHNEQVETALVQADMAIARSVGQPVIEPAMQSLSADQSASELEAIIEQAMPARQAEAVMAGMAIKNDRESAVTPLTETIRVSVDKIENMQSSLSELVAIRLLQKDGHEKILEIQDSVAAANTLWRNIKNDMAEFRSYLPNHIVSKMNSKMSDYSSHVKSIQRCVFHLSNQIATQAGQLNLLSDEIDNGLRSIRMMPIGPFLESYRSVARDAARQLQKTVNVECYDRGIEIDRLILEKIKEPILHIVRNCVGHGIEAGNLRVASGKPEAGTIQMQAELSGDYVLIRIMDDGAGFNRQRIAEEARKHGLLKADEQLDDNRILELVTRSGFSTARQADMVSGRGVGMDVVATMLAELGGVLELETEEGLGSCFTLRVPSSLAISQGLILRIGSKRFGIVLDTVERIVRTKIANLGVVQGKQVFYMNDDPVAVTSLATVLGFSELEPKSPQMPMPMVVLCVGSQRLALMVDDIPGEIPMVIKSMGPQFEHIHIYAGGAILSDGSVLPVLDTRHIVKMVADNNGLRMNEWTATDQHLPLADMHGEALKTRGTIIVVDDSITTRTLERNILEAAGYKVSVATDGVEALDLLMLEDNVSLVVTDMEMPRMNGIELCRTIRAGRYAELPIIMVTSVGDAAEMKKGIQAGADAYIVKGDFQQEHFLETVRRFVQR